MKNDGSRVVIGTRGSELALAQSEIVRQKLRAVEPGLAVEIKIIKTQGDVDASPIPLDTVGKGWFTKEIEDALLAGSIDLAVHSLKDLPEDLPEGLRIGAFPEREDARDVLVSAGNLPLAGLRKGAVIGTDSMRRKMQILALRSDVTVESVRGNVPTRVKKLRDGHYDAIVIAAAGLIRLGLQKEIAHYFSVDEITPAPGQGILAVELRADDAARAELVKKINDPEAEAAATAERTFSARVGGGCKEPVGAYAAREGERMMLQGMLARAAVRQIGVSTQDGVAPAHPSVMREAVTGPRNQGAALATSLAETMLAKFKDADAEK